MAEKRTKGDKAQRRADQLQKKAETGSEPTPKDRRQGAIRSGEERRKIKIPPPPGSPVRSGLDRRTGDRRTGSLPVR
jgi:hypothetical protein